MLADYHQICWNSIQNLSDIASISVFIIVLLLKVEIAVVAFAKSVAAAQDSFTLHLGSTVQEATSWLSLRLCGCARRPVTARRVPGLFKIQSTSCPAENRFSSKSGRRPRKIQNASAHVAAHGPRFSDGSTFFGFWDPPRSAPFLRVKVWSSLQSRRD